MKARTSIKSFTLEALPKMRIRKRRPIARMPGRKSTVVGELLELLDKTSSGPEDGK